MKNRTFLALYLPHWSTELLKFRFRSDPNLRLQPIALVSVINRKKVVMRACKVARTCGVTDGISLSLAKALCPKIKFVQYSPEHDLKKLERLAISLLKFSPLIGIDPLLVSKLKVNRNSVTDSELSLIGEIEREDLGIILDITGTERIYDDANNGLAPSQRKLHESGFHLLASHLFKSLRAQGFSPKIAIAPTIGAAWALSRFGVKDIEFCEDRDIRSLLGYLPIRALRVSQRTEEQLNEIGIINIAQLCSLPQKSIGLRFGIEVLNRLNQAVGLVDEALVTLHELPNFSEELTLDIPISNQETVSQVLISLLDRNLTKLSRLGVRARSYDLVFRIKQSDGDCKEISKKISLYTASHNLTKIRGIIYPIIEKLQIPGEIVKLVIKADEIVRVSGEQPGIFGSADQMITEEAKNEVLNLISANLGESALKKGTIVDSYIPEKSFKYTPIREKSKVVEGSSKRVHLLDRPPQLLKDPEKISVVALLPDAPPARLIWRGVEHQIKSGIGPERISPEWWSNRDGTNRDYFKVQDNDGRWLWVYRNQSTQEWWMHGVWG